MSKRSHKRASLFQSRIVLVAAGVGLGYLARLVFGAPAIEDSSPHQLRPYEDRLKEAKPEEIDLPLERPNRFSPQPWELEQQGLVPPLHIPGQILVHNPGQLPGQKPGQKPIQSPRPLASQSTGELTSGEPGDFLSNPPASMAAGGADDWNPYAHDPTAAFHPHGEQVCASGCAASRHPTATLTRPHFEQLLAVFANEPMNQTSNALEELLYFGPQTKRLMERVGCPGLDPDRKNFLWTELRKTHARISIRVVDEEGRVRTWLDGAAVPLDRRHVFEMETRNLQPLVTSGTVKRVGLNHLWTRL